MRFGINVPNFGEYASPRSLVQLAIETERAGWDGFFVWDHIVIGNGIPVADSWVLLAAVAQATERVAIGPMVTPVPRRRPWVLARQAVTVDYLSDGRLILGVGTGFPADVEFGTFNEPTSDRERAGMLDEGLTIIQGIWSGEPFAYQGAHFRVRQTSFAPRPLRPIPIWVAGMWPNRAPFRRAARYNGAYPIADDLHRLSVAEISDIAAYLDRFRTESRPYDIVIGGHRPSGRQISEYEAAGVTWCMVGPAEGEPLGKFAELVARGPGLLIADQSPQDRRSRGLSGRVYFVRKPGVGYRAHPSIRGSPRTAPIVRESRADSPTRAEQRQGRYPSRGL